MDIRTFQPGHIAVERHRGRAVQGPVHATATPGPRRADVAVLPAGSSMRVMEAGLATVAIGTAVLLGLGR